MTFTIEPMLNLGTHEWEMWDDGWTVVTKDRRRTRAVRAHPARSPRPARDPHPALRTTQRMTTGTAGASPSASTSAAAASRARPSTSTRASSPPERIRIETPAAVHPRGRLPRSSPRSSTRFDGAHGDSPIGVTIPGVVTARRRAARPRTSTSRGSAPTSRRMLARRGSGTPVVVVNDADAAGVGEMLLRGGARPRAAWSCSPPWAPASAPPDLRRRAGPQHRARPPRDRRLRRRDPGRHERARARGPRLGEVGARGCSGTTATSRTCCGPTCSSSAAGCRKKADQFLPLLDLRTPIVPAAAARTRPASSARPGWPSTAPATDGPGRSDSRPAPAARRSSRPRDRRGRSRRTHVRAGPAHTRRGPVGAGRAGPSPGAEVLTWREVELAAARAGAARRAPARRAAARSAAGRRSCRGCAATARGAGRRARRPRPARRRGRRRGGRTTARPRLEAHADVVDARDVVVDEGVPLTERGDRHGPDVRRLARDRCCAARPAATSCSAAAARQQPRLGVGGEQGGQPLGVEVVGVLVGDEDRVEVGEVGETGENVPGSTSIRVSAVSTRTQEWPRWVMRMLTTYAEPGDLGVNGLPAAGVTQPAAGWSWSRTCPVPRCGCRRGLPPEPPAPVAAAPGGHPAPGVPPAGPAGAGPVGSARRRLVVAVAVVLAVEQPGEQ